MAVNDIGNINSVLATVLQGQSRSTVPLATSPLNVVTNPVAVATAVTQNLTPAQQAAVLGTEAVQTLNLQPSAPTDPLLATGTAPDMTTVLESPGLSPAQEAALAVNQTVQAAIQPQNLTPAQQAALTVNQATQALATQQTPAETAAATAITTPTPAPAPVETTLAAAGIAGGGGATATTPAGSTAVSAVTTAAPTVVPATPTTAATTVAAPAEAMPAQPTVAQPIPYANAFAVYEVRNPTPPPREPAAIRKEVHPAVPVGRVRPVDPLVLRQEWEKRKREKRQGSGQAVAAAPRPPLAEKAIRDLVRQANETLAASGVPLHLVLSQSAEGFALDVYECLNDAMCEMTQEVPLDLNNLMTILDNLEHESGIIININT